MNRYNYYNSDLDAFEIYHIEAEELERLAHEPPAKPEPASAIRTPAEYNAVIAGLSGAIGTSIANTIVYPIDLIVKRLQVQRVLQHDHESDGKDRGRSYDGFVDAAARIYRDEGGRRLQAQARSSPSSKPPKTLGVIEELSIGVLAGATAKLFTAPIANIVTHKQTAALHRSDTKSDHQSKPSSDASSVKAIIENIYADKGLRGFWAGYDATLLLTINPATTFLLYETFKSLLPRRYRDRPTAGQTFILAAVAKAVASAAMYPISMAKTQSQVRGQDGKSSSIYSTLVGICRAGGILAMYEGIWGEVLKGFFSNGI
ncbi:Mitoferrin-2 [Orbilia brochopaga]|nr:Mitoferrin-2 [Drechslerella brochopaga]